MTMDPTLVSIQVGQPRAWGRADASDPLDKPWRSAFVKTPVDGPVFAGRINLAGDAQADLKYHGGPDKAICVYAIDHYASWAATIGVEALPPAAFGENFSVRGLTEVDVCIGDTWEVGAIAVQISQPRQPCWKLARRWRIKDLAYQVQTLGRTGWYFRVLTEGLVEAGQALRLRARPHPAWTVAAANAVMHERKQDVTAAAALAALPELSESWRRTLARRVEEGWQPDAAVRLGFTPSA